LVTRLARRSSQTAVAQGSREPDATAPRRPIPWLPFFLGLAAVIAASAFAVWLLAIRPAEKAVGGLRDAVADAFRNITGQKVTVHANTVTIEKSNIAELSLVQRKTQTVIKFESDFIGSRKTLILRGDFIVKAGFDLSQPFTASVDEATGEVKADLPPAKITSVELKDYEVFFSDDGLINKLRAEDQELATRTMITQARIDAERSDIKQEAEEQLKQRLRDLLKGDAQKLILRGEEVMP
jgi:hypothetical protein